MPVWAQVLVRLAGVLVAFLLLPLLVGQLEHKAMAHMQARLGPMYAGGFHGWAQLVADGVKFVQKENVVPSAADRAVFTLAPAIGLVPYLLVLVAIPLGPDGLVAQPLDIGLFFVLAIVGIGVIGMLMAAWASANKYSLLGGLRGAAQLLGYELPFVLAAASVAMAAGTLSLPGIVAAWQPWWVLWQLPALFVFFTAGLEGPGRRRAAWRSVDAGQGVPGGVRGDLGAGVLSPAARGPVAAAVLAWAAAGRARPAGAHRRGEGRRALDVPRSSTPPCSGPAKITWSVAPMTRRPKSGATHQMIFRVATSRGTRHALPTPTARGCSPGRVNRCMI
jgi:hypothetical protein